MLSVSLLPKINCNLPRISSFFLSFFSSFSSVSPPPLQLAWLLFIGNFCLLRWLLVGDMVACFRLVAAGIPAMVAVSVGLSVSAQVAVGGAWQKAAAGAGF